MGNVMTPFSPPQAAFTNRVVNILASGPYTGTFYANITATQAENDTFYISGTATAAFGSTTKLFFINLPTTASTKIYTFNAGNITMQPTSGPTAETLMGVSVGPTGNSVSFSPNTTFQVVYSASGYGSAGIPTVTQLSPTNIFFST